MTNELEFLQLPEAQQDRIAAAGIEMIAAISDAFGAERGQKMWEGMGEAMGMDVRNHIFMALLSGRKPNSVSIHGPIDYWNGSGTRGVNKVAFIKAIRVFTGMGLKEAKVFAESFTTETVKTITGKSPTSPDARTEFIRVCREEGINAF